MSDIEQWLEEAGQLFPAAKGSVREVRRVCGHPTCKRCASGEKHQGFLFTYYVDGKQKSHNVPRHKVAPLKEALENGRRIERLMVRNALAMIQTDRGRKKR
jgi:hypothetical protein